MNEEDIKLRKEFEEALDFLKFYHRKNKEQLNKVRLIEEKYVNGNISIEDIKRFKDRGMKK